MTLRRSARQTRPSMRFVPTKSEQQQSGLMLHRSRQLLVRQRTMLSGQTEPQLAQEAERRKIALPAEDPNQGRARNMRFRRKLVQRPWMRGSSQHGGDGSGRRRRCEQPYYAAR